MDNVKRGRIPSIDRVQLLAKYLGTTTSELLGEEMPTPKKGGGLSEDEQMLMDLIAKLSSAQRQFLEDWLKTALSKDP